MRNALSKEDIETLNALQVEAEKVLAGERCWDSRYKAIEARVVLDGVHFIQSIEDRFDFYIGTGKALPDEMISAELNLDDPASWIARVADLPARRQEGLCRSPAHQEEGILAMLNGIIHVMKGNAG